MKKAVVLLSGGIDSTVTLAIAKSEGFDIYALSFDYGQRHAIELLFAKKSAVQFRAAKHLVIKSNLRAIGGSALTSDLEVPKDRETLPVMPVTEIPDTYVPARNTIFLSFGLAFAESVGAEDIFIGANAVDYSGYPDCRPQFIRAFETMANLATKASVEGKAVFKIQAPLIHSTKAEILQRGAALGVDYSLAWSCYDPQPAAAGVNSLKLKVKKEKKEHSRLITLNSKFIPCMRCDSCLLRAKGFHEAGIEDPIIYHSRQ